jgi:hypothetical protein
MMCECGHDSEYHIYHESACRPGFVCQFECKQFKSIELKENKMKTTCLTVEFLSVTGYAIQVTSDFESINLVVKDEIKYWTFPLNVDNAESLIESLKLAIEHNKRIK